MNTAYSISRRQLLGSGLSLWVTLLPGVARPAAPAADVSPLEIYARARGGGDDPGLWWYTGRLWGKPVHGDAVNFFAVEGFSFNRMEREPGGGLTQVMEECGFWKDPDGKEILDEWVNPLTGLRCTPRHYRTRQALSFSPAGIVNGNSGYSGHITEPVVSGPTLWISESLALRFPGDRRADEDPLAYNGPVRTATSLVTYTLDAETALAADPGFVPSTMNFQSMSNWYPWMRMGLAPGQMMFELFGRKLASLAELPGDLRKLLDDRQPGFLENPSLSRI
jgi:hypothetical protein